MMRSTVRLLVVVMCLASGRLLACGWECIDELAAPASASCHQESAPVTVLNGEAAHACLPELAGLHVTVAKSPASQSLVAPPVVTAFVTLDQPADSSSHRPHSIPLRFESPHLPAPSVLRI